MQVVSSAINRRKVVRTGQEFCNHFFQSVDQIFRIFGYSIVNNLQMRVFEPHIFSCFIKILQHLFHKLGD
eukprot:06989.XXX_118305_118514_1 [CDS] Oithona nana genome sequencing.